MKVSERWLRTLINPALTITELAEQLTQASLEVDSLEKIPEQEQESVCTFKIPPNRGDCLSMEGIAREVSLLNNLPYQKITPAAITPTLKDTFPVDIKAVAACPRYVSCVLRNVDVMKPVSPEIKERLELAGIRSINRVVDILNYVMLELGQPLHAFDLETLKSSLQVRYALANEKMVLLDGQTLNLNPTVLVISDSEKAQALAGIMGGLGSSVTEKTRHILIESAYFDPVTIRLGSQHSGLKTDASYRFERGVDPSLPNRALQRVLQLLNEDGKLQAGPISVHEALTHLPKVPVVHLRHKRIARILGKDFSSETIFDILNRAGMKVTETDEGFHVIAPSFRHDIALEEDLIEEIARVSGLETFLSTALTGEMQYPATTHPNFKNRLKTVLVDRGFNEAVTYSFIDPEWLEVFQYPTHSLALKNPISREMAVMRASLWPGLLQAVQYNQRRQSQRGRLFEMGTCFSHDQESLYLGLVVFGAVHQEQWGLANKPHDFYDLKADMEALFSVLKGFSLRFESSEHPALHTGQSAQIIAEDKTIGWIGSLHPRLLKALDLEGPVSLAEINLEDVLREKTVRFQALSKFPMIRRDLAVVIDQQVTAAILKEAILETAGELLESVVLFDVYQGKGVAPGKKSVAIGLSLRHATRTLVENEINDIIKRVILMLSDRFKATLRE